MFSSAALWWGEEGAKASCDVVTSAHANRRLLPPFGWAKVIGDTTSIILLFYHCCEEDLWGIPTAFVNMIGSVCAVIICWVVSDFEEA